MSFGRSVELEFGPPGAPGRRVDHLRIDFDVKHSDAATPSEARIVVFGVSDDLVAAAQAEGTVFRLSAGYDVPAVIFTGVAVRGGVRREGDVLTVDAVDGGREYASRSVDVWRAGESAPKLLIGLAAAAMGVPVAVALVGVERPLQAMRFAGRAGELLDLVCTATASSWRVTDGVLYVLPAGSARFEAAPVWTAEGGALIGREKPTDEGVEVTALLAPEMRPRRLFVVPSGTYRATEVVFTGSSTEPGPFYVQCRGRPR